LQPGAFKLPDGTAGEIAGRGPPLILLHGIGLDRSMWQAQVYCFARSYSVIRYDLLGHGESARIEGRVQLDDFTRQLEKLCSALKLDRAALAGFSFGGMIAQAFALKHSRQLAKLVLISTVHDRSAMERAGVENRLETARRQGPLAIYPAALERWFSPAFLAGQPEFVQQLHHRMMDNDVGSFLHAYEVFALGDRELVGRLGVIACPTLVMTGERDMGSTPAMAWKIAKEIPGARVSIIADGRHMMPIEMADDVNRELSCFLVER
jgi:(E)-2-((N-methylformamido)methylene)succinate hydrolase